MTFCTHVMATGIVALFLSNPAAPSTRCNLARASQVPGMRVQTLYSVHSDIFPVHSVYLQMGYGLYRGIRTKIQFILTTVLMVSCCVVMSTN
jgi:hypothetical protein